MKRAILIAAVALAAGCASHKVIIDRRGVDMAQYEQDLAECQDYAREVEAGREVAQEAARGAVVGGLVGAVVGNSRTAGKLGGAGAVTGASRGARKAELEAERVVRNCLAGRGYRVLN